MATLKKMFFDMILVIYSIYGYVNIKLMILIFTGGNRKILFH